jgi:hypothetical protein
MENIMETVVSKLLEVGFYDLLIFVIALALFYGILKKIKFFEGSTVINAALAFAISFLIFGFPVIMNFSLVLPLARFFTTSFVFVIVFLVGMLVASFFYPDLPKFLTEHFKTRTMISVGMAIGVAVAVISGIAGILYAAPPKGPSTLPITPSDTGVVSSGTIVFIILLIVAGSIALQGLQK